MCSKLEGGGVDTLLSVVGRTVLVVSRVIRNGGQAIAHTPIHTAMSRCLKSYLGEKQD